MLLILSTCPAEAAAALARTLVEEGLAACVNIVPTVHSVYRWEGQVESASESLLLIKTTAARYLELEPRLRALHPYALPEIIALPIERGLPGYLDWLASSVAPHPG